MVHGLKRKLNFFNFLKNNCIFQRFKKMRVKLNTQFLQMFKLFYTIANLT
jgi:hypothetical protein